MTARQHGSIFSNTVWLSLMFSLSRPVGATLMTAGTSIGAGMLALPIVASQLGFLTASLLVLVSWGMMFGAALLTVEVNLSVRPGCTLFVMASQTLSNGGRLLVIAAVVFLYYSLLAAYMAGGGQQVGHYLSVLWPQSDHSSGLGPILFALVFSLVIVVGVKGIDLCNRLLFMVMLGAFTVACGALLAEVQVDQVVRLPEDHRAILAALPVICTAFGYHGSIPSLVAYVGPDRAVLRRVLLYGSLLPLVLYLAWLATCFGLLEGNDLAALAGDTGIPDLIARLSAAQPDSPYVATALNLFSSLALITSFLGVAWGLFDFVHSALSCSSRWRTALVVFVPPAVIACTLSGVYVAALNYAAFALALLAVVIPVAMLFSLYRSGRLQSQPSLWLVVPVCIYGGLVCYLTVQ